MPVHVYFGTPTFEKPFLVPSGIGSLTLPAFSAQTLSFAESSIPAKLKNKVMNIIKEDSGQYVNKRLPIILSNNFSTLYSE